MKKKIDFKKIGKKKRLLLFLLIFFISGVGFSLIFIVAFTKNDGKGEVSVVTYEEYMHPPAPKTKYYCIDNYSLYLKKKKEFSNDWGKLREYFIANQETSYDFKWYRHGKDWFLDTSNWNFVVPNKKFSTNAKPVWPKDVCSISTTKKQIHCSIVYFQGLLWRARFSLHEGPNGEFIKILLYRIPVSPQAKRRQRLAELLGVKEVNDVDICLREGPSPLKEIFKTQQN